MPHSRYVSHAVSNYSTKVNSVHERIQYEDDRCLNSNNQQVDQESVLKLGTINNSVASH